MQKVVAVTARQLVAQLDGYRRAIDLDPGRDRIVSWLPLYHDMGLIAGFLLPLLTGTPLVLLDTFEWAANPALLLRAIEAERATLCWLPNFAFQLLARIEAAHDLRSMRAFVNCSEPVSRGAFRAFCARHGVAPRQLAVSYGLAENVFAVSQTPIGRPPRVLIVDRARYQRGLIEVRGVTGALDDPDPDACTPLLGPDGRMDNALRADAIHLDPRHLDVYVRLLEDALGPIDWEPVPAAAIAWDGTRPGFEHVVKELIRQVVPDRGEPDYEHLVSGGVLTSLDILALTAGLLDRLGVEIPSAEIRRDRFESLDAIFEHFVKPRPQDRTGH